MSFEVVIIGAGIGGLCTAIGLAKQGHHVTILESAKQLTPIGVGIHLPSNATLVLQHFGLLDRMAPDAIYPSTFIFRRWDSNRILSSTPVGKRQFGAVPYWSMRRSHYQEHLLNAALDSGVKLVLDSRVVSVDEDAPSVAFSDGQTIKADIVVLADGVKSKLRGQIIPEENTNMVINPLSAYRGYVHHDDLISDPITAPLFTEPASNVWMGHGRSVIVYPCGGGLYTVGATHPAGPNEKEAEAMEWNRGSTVAQAGKEYEAWNPVVQRILHHMKDIGKWRLAEVPRLPRWTSKSGKVVMVGDCAHAMVQFLAQGAAMATEDAGALSVALGRAKTTEDIPRVLRAFERARKWRCEAVQAQARRNGDMIHMPDGEEQENRDRAMANLDQTGVWKADTGPMFDADFRRFLYGHNVIEHVRKVLDEAGL